MKLEKTITNVLDTSLIRLTVATRKNSVDVFVTVLHYLFGLYEVGLSSSYSCKSNQIKSY